MQTNTPKPTDVKSVRVKGIERLERQDVYNLSVDKDNSFAVNGGIIVHNCDALRYFVKTKINRPRLMRS